MSKEMIDVLNGNELIIQGALEAGFHLYTGYPGSPLADFFNILHERKKEFLKKGIRVVIANNEANAAAMASGAKQAHKNTLVAMKSMGLNVAADALSVGNFSLPGKGGTVVVVGDDPWSMSTSAPMDSRYLFKHLHLPFFDPSTPEELKNWIAEALHFSLETTLYCGVLLTTAMAEGGGRVALKVEKKIDSPLIDLNPSHFDLKKNVMVPPNSLFADQAMILERFPKVIKYLENHSLDRIEGNEDSKIGLVASGAVFEQLRHVLLDRQLLTTISLYKVAMPYPLSEVKLLPYLKKLTTLIVVEEKRGFLESELHELIMAHHLPLKIYGKKFGDAEGFPISGGLSYDIINQKLDTFFGNSNRCREFISLDLPKRLPTFCPGCPHRETLSLLKDLRKKLEKENIHLITHGDVGCYSLSFLAPFKEMHNLSAMGQGGALGSGLDIFTTNPSVVLMGDSTFFHSGVLDISHSLQMDHSITYIILDNDNTAMTGHQMTPRSGQSVEGAIRPRQDILAMVKALGVHEALEVNPSDRFFYQNMLGKLILTKGVKVIVSNKECGLTFYGRQRQEERKSFDDNAFVPVKTFYQINTAACENCRECLEMTGCPGLTHIFDPYGKKMAIDSQICVGDSYCTKIKACPSFEKVEVKKYLLKTPHSLISNSLLPLPTPVKSLNDIAEGDHFRLLVTGVGGSGVTTISKIISKAAQKMAGRMDLDFKFIDQKGLAQRNGNVTSHLMIFKKGHSESQMIRKGGADVIISPDLLDGANHVSFLSESGHMILDEDFQIPLSMLLDREEESPQITKEELIQKLKNEIASRLLLLKAHEKSQEVFHKGVYKNAMILGFTLQKGLLPFSFEDMLNAFAQAIPKKELDFNLEAFHIGRKMAILTADQVKGEDFQWPLSLIRKSMNQAYLFKKISENDFVSLIEKIELLTKKMISKEYIAFYIHDMYVYDGFKEKNQFLENCQKLVDYYSNDKQLLEMALRTLVRTYFIKDEIFIAHQMINPIRKCEDQLKYKNLGTSYKKTFINRPSFQITRKWKWEFDYSPSFFELGLLRHGRFLRILLPEWHRKEREIAFSIREKLIQGKSDYSALKKLENISGYREFRFNLASELLQEKMKITIKEMDSF